MIPLPHQWLCQDTDGAIRHGEPLPAALLAGSFNPIHRGHRQLAAVAQRVLGLPVAFEISMANVDKPELPEDEVRRRLRQFVGIAPVYVTRSPTFQMKAEIFPGSVLVVGCDTAVRIVDPRYYGGALARRDEALHFIRERGCRFLVAGRLDATGRFVGLENIEIPEAFRNLFESIPEAEFRADVSSTELRSRCQES